MINDNILTLAIFSLFILAPFIAVLIERLQDKAKNKINKHLKPHGLRLKKRG